MPHRELHIVPSASASSTLHRIQQRIEDTAIHELTYALFTSLIHEWKDGINRAGFTLSEIYSMVAEGRRAQSDRQLTADLCSIDCPLAATASFSEESTFREKLQGLTRHERCGLAFILNECWLARDCGDAEAVLKRFSLHGISLLA
ncbi:hypothetical protein ACPWT1_03005 [Ramlibacter sp. MMS24-I3-19]|uniref:hypothetical protein n=1 Tax=Ramlibacter sp. MMS24-I3-19 TaxID=3416606 RepID=UPI003D0836C8